MKPVNIEVFSYLKLNKYSEFILKYCISGKQKADVISFALYNVC